MHDAAVRKALSPSEQRTRALMQVLISLGLLVVGVLILMSPNPVLPHRLSEDTKRLASGWIGTIIGYWLY